MKAKKDITLIVLPNASMKDIDTLKEAMEKSSNFVFVNKECKMFIIRKGQMFEIVMSEKFIKKIEEGDKI